MEKEDIKKKRGGAREGAGRPTLFGEKKRVSLYLESGNLEKLEGYAMANGFSRSDALNVALEKFFESDLYWKI